MAKKELETIGDRIAKNGGFRKTLESLAANRSKDLSGVIPKILEKGGSATKMLGKKALGILPLAGAAYAALQGDPAMAAEEMAGDIPVVGQAYEAIRPDVAGESSEDERIMLAEDQARKNYKLAKLKAMLERQPAGAKEDIEAIPMPNFAGDVPPEEFDKTRNETLEKKEMLRRLLQKQ